VRWDFDNTWIIRDAFMQRWRVRLVPLQDRPSPADPSDDPLFSMISSAFADAYALRDDMASDLIEIYDALMGTHFGTQLPRPTRDPQRRLHGFKSELERVLYAAVETGELRFERDEPGAPIFKDEKPPSKRDAPPAEEKVNFIAVNLVDEAGRPVRGRRYRIELPNGTTREGRFDDSGTIRFDDVDPGTVRFLLFDPEARQS